MVCTAAVNQLRTALLGSRRFPNRFDDLGGRDSATKLQPETPKVILGENLIRKIELYAKACPTGGFHVVKTRDGGGLDTGCNLVMELPHHPNLVSTIFNGIVNGHAYTTMEFINGRSLDYYINLLHSLSFSKPSTSAGADEISSLSLEESLEYRNVLLKATLEMYLGLCNGVIHLHDHGVLHRDIKPSNCMVEVNDDGSFTPKLIDFESCIENGVPVNEYFGTPAYMAPENCLEIDLGTSSSDTVFNNACVTVKGNKSGNYSYSKASDVYALGATLYQLFTGNALYSGCRNKHKIFNAKKTENFSVTSILKPEKHKFPEMCKLINRCLAKNPKHRPTAAEVRDEVKRFIDSLQGNEVGLEFDLLDHNVAMSINDEVVQHIVAQQVSQVSSEPAPLGVHELETMAA